MGEFIHEDVILYLEDCLNRNKIDFSAIYNELESNYSSSIVAKAFKEILSNSSNVKLLDLTIREISLFKYKENLADLVDFILLNNTENDFLNLKVIAIKIISNYKDTSSVSALMYCLNNKNSNYKIRLAAAEALGKIGDKNAFESLTNIVCDNDEKSAYVKESAVTALGMLGDNRALDVFESIINTKQMFMDKFIYLKERIIEAIGKLEIQDDTKAISILKNSILDPSEALRINSIETLMNIDSKESYDLIYDRLKYDDSLEVRKNALIALYNISDRRILDEVIKNDFPEELKNEAKTILIEYEENQ